jgi:hypothetical protein
MDDVPNEDAQWLRTPTSQRLRTPTSADPNADEHA